MKIYFTIVALCVTVTSFAQIEKGRSYVSGQVGGGTVNATYDTPGRTGPEKQTAFNIALGYGYMVTNTWAVAVSVEGGRHTSKYTVLNNQSRSVGTSYSVSPYVRRYFSIAEKFYFHLDGGLNYQTEKSKYSDNLRPISTEFNAKVVSLYIAPGLTYFLSGRFALTANLGTLNYTNSKEEGADNVTQKGFNTSFGLNSITFGASVYF